MKRYGLINSDGEILRYAEFADDEQVPILAIEKGLTWIEAPHESPAPEPKWAMSSLEFLERFTEAEQLAVVTATLANPEVKLWYDKLLAAEYVNLHDQRVSHGLSVLAGQGLLSIDRVPQLLTPA